MALLFMDSFDHYATADLTEKWTQVASTNGNDTQPVIGAYGRNSTQGLYLNRSYAAGTYVGLGPSITVVPSGSTFIAGAAVKYNAFASLNTGTYVAFEWSTMNWLFLVRNVNENQFAARVNSDGTISVLRVSGSTGTVLGTTSLSLQGGVWAYVELKVVIHSSAGTVDLRINGTSALSLTGQNTRGGSADAWSNVHFAMLTGSTNIHTLAVDDVVIMDASGSFNNDLLGDVTITAIYPNGAGNSSDWAPSAGSNYQNVDDTTPNDDTDYNSTSTLNAKDLYAFPSAPAGADIRAVQIVSAQRKGAEGPGKIKHVVRSGGTDYDQAEQGIGGTSYAFLRSVVEADPGSGSPLEAWTESGFNAAEFGIKKTG